MPGIEAETMAPTKIGAKEYLVNLVISHPLNSNKVYSGCTKLLLNDAQNLIFDQEKREESMFEPNGILFPLREFSILTEIQDLTTSSSAKKSLKFTVDLSKEVEGTSFVSFSEGNVLFQAEF